MWRKGLSIIFWLIFSVVTAHTVSINELRGETLCVAPETVQVSIVNSGGSKQYEEEKFVSEQLNKTLRQVFSTYDIPFKEKTACNRGAGFTYILYHASWGADTNGLPYLVYTASVQVGNKKEPVEANFDYVLNKLSFENYTSALLFEDELPKPVHAGLLEISEEMITELALGWWEGFELERQAKQARQPLVLRRVLAVSVFVSSLIIALGIGFVSKRQQSRLKQKEV